MRGECWLPHNDADALDAALASAVGNTRVTGNKKFVDVRAAFTGRGPRLSDIGIRPSVRKGHRISGHPGPTTGSITGLIE